MFKVYTQDTGSDVASNLAAQYFEGFTVLRGVGCWRGKFERSLVVEIDGMPRAKVYDYARALKDALAQEAVLVQEIGSTSLLV